MPALKHLHTYQRIKPGDSRYLCIHPDCSHTQRKELMLGKRAMCYCGNEYYLTSNVLKLQNPHCPDCTKGHSKIDPLDLQLEMILPELIKPRDLQIEEDENQLALRFPAPNKFEGDMGGEL